MGIRFYCPNGHKLNVKDFQAGQKGICPYCGAKMQIPAQSTRKSSKEERAEMQQQGVELAISDSRPPELSVPTVANSAAAEAAFTEQRMPSAPLDLGATAQHAPRTYPAGGPILSTPAGPGGAIPGAPISGPTTPAAASPATALPMAKATPAPVDPLVAAGNSVWYVRPSSGGQFGPAMADIMRSWLEEGRISSDSMVWCEGWPDWVGAVTVFHQLGPAIAPKTATVKPPTGTSGLPTSDAPPHVGRAWPRRSRDKTTQAAVITALVLTVIALLIVFLVVINLH